MSRLKTRIAKLEQRSGGTRRYVYYRDEKDAMAAAAARGERFAILPRRCATVKEWIERHAPDAIAQPRKR